MKVHCGYNFQTSVPVNYNEVNNFYTILLCNCNFNKSSGLTINELDKIME